MARDILMPVLVEQIDIPTGRREIDRSVVNRLAESIETIGLKHPITVRREGERYALIAGLHRLEAVKKLKLDNIPACIVTMSKAESRMWEIAENLHRADLTKQERAEQIAEWIELIEKSQQSAKPAQLGQVSGGRGREGGISAASRELGITRQEAQRAVKIASITPEAKEAAREHGLDDNQSKLLEVAKEAPERQAAKVIELAARKPVAMEKWLSDGMLWWNRGAQEWRVEFLARIENQKTGIRG